jgi:hypothetical protein
MDHSQADSPTLSRDHLPSRLSSDEMHPNRGHDPLHKTSLPRISLSGVLAWQTMASRSSTECPGVKLSKISARLSCSRKTEARFWSVSYARTIEPLAGIFIESDGRQVLFADSGHPNLRLVKRKKPVWTGKSRRMGQRPCTSCPPTHSIARRCCHLSFDALADLTRTEFIKFF